ncbi:uncharacterized protein LOC100206582 [Hydra vulgaris]|uniref:Heat shock factor protein 5 n=1 Tax=Hydra vulgaris TaxID=6087 RepID=T2MCX2_HYDVU|nr:transcription factor prr1-like [Hydra vulgaris]
MSNLNDNKENLLSFHLRHFSKKNKPLSPFVSKLRFLLNNPKYRHAIHWSEDGCYIVVTDIESFRQSILENEEEMFKTNNFTSFVRQLNLYGFRKIPSNGKCDPMKNMKFEHLYFRREQPDLMHLVHRTCLPSRRRSDIGITLKNTQACHETLSKKNIESAVKSNHFLNQQAPFFTSYYNNEHEIKDIFFETPIKNILLENNCKKKKEFDYTKTLNDGFTVRPTSVFHKIYKEHDYAISGSSSDVPNQDLTSADIIVDEKLTYAFLNRNFNEEKEVVQSLLSLKYSRSISSKTKWDALSTLADVSLKLPHNETSIADELCYFKNHATEYS